ASRKGEGSADAAPSPAPPRTENGPIARLERLHQPAVVVALLDEPPRVSPEALGEFAIAQEAHHLGGELGRAVADQHVALRRDLEPLGPERRGHYRHAPGHRLQDLHPGPGPAVNRADEDGAPGEARGEVVDVSGHRDAGAGDSQGPDCRWWLG